jgi:hypothetical protein
VQRKVKKRSYRSVKSIRIEMHSELIFREIHTAVDALGPVPQNRSYNQGFAIRVEAN